MRQPDRHGIYVKAKADTSWRFWGLYVHVCKLDTLREAYALAKKNDGAPGSDGVTFEAIEAQGVEAFLGQIADELVGRTYVPLPAKKQEIPKDGGKVRVLSIPAIRDRVVQGALKLILEPIFEADFQPGSFGYRPQRTAHEAVDRVARAIVQHKTRVIDIDLKSYFDNVRHDRLLAKVAEPAQMLRVGGDGGQRLGGGPEQEVVDGALVLERDGADRSRQGEDDVIIRNRQQLRLAVFEPLRMFSSPPALPTRWA